MYRFFIYRLIRFGVVFLALFRYVFIPLGLVLVYCVFVYFVISFIIRLVSCLVL